MVFAFHVDFVVQGMPVTKPESPARRTYHFNNLWKSKAKIRRLTSKTATKQSMSMKSTHMIFVVAAQNSTFGCCWCLNTIARSCTNTKTCLWDTPSIPASFVDKKQNGNVRAICLQARPCMNVWRRKKSKPKIQAKLHLSRGRSKKARTRKILKSVFKPKLREIGKLRLQTKSLFQFWIDSTYCLKSVAKFTQANNRPQLSILWFFESTHFQGQLNGLKHQNTTKHNNFVKNISKIVLPTFPALFTTTNYENDHGASWKHAMPNFKFEWRSGQHVF